MQQSRNPINFTLDDHAIQFSLQVMATARNTYRKKNLLSRKSSQAVAVTPADNPAKSLIQASSNQQNVVEAPEKNKIKDFFTQLKKPKQIPLTARSKRYGAADGPIPKTQSLHFRKQKSLPTTAIVNLVRTHFESQAEIKQPEEAEKTQNSFTKLQNKYSGKLLSQNYLQSWLNEALIEASPGLSISKKEQNSGLKAYSVDRSSLLRAGINPQNIGRLYRSFFVYSVGFNNLIKQICVQDANLRNSMWRVFAVLLEYCSGGKFETVIGQIQRDKQIKLIELKSEIQKRQMIIEKIDETNQHKNAKIIKQLRELQQKNQSLHSEREMILEDFHQAQQSFNQEVALRLKYETRINEIHGVYEQLRQKYKLLKQKYDKNQKLLEAQKLAQEQLDRKFAHVTKERDFNAKTVITLYEEKVALIGSQQKLKDQLSEATKKLLQFKKQAQITNINLDESRRKIEHLELSVESLQSSEKCLERLLASQNQQFQRAMNENQQLHRHLHQSMKQISAIVQQKRQLGHHTAQVQSLVAIQKKKLEQKQSLLRQRKSQIQELENKRASTETNLQIQLLRVESLEKDIENYQASIKLMKAKYNEVDEMVSLANRKVQYLQQLLQNKQNEQSKYITQIEKLKSKIQEQKIVIIQKQSKLMMMEQNNRTISNIWELRLKKIESEAEDLREKLDCAVRDRSSASTEMEQYKQKHDRLYMQLKNQRFERNNLQLYYKQSLTVLEQEISHIKQQGIQISQIGELYQQSKRNCRNLERTSSETIKQLQAQISRWQSMFSSLQSRINDRQEYVHPLVYEDLHSRCSLYFSINSTLAERSRDDLKKIKDMEGLLFKYEQQAKSSMRESSSQGEQQTRLHIDKLQYELRVVKERLELTGRKLSQAELIVEETTREKAAAQDSLRQIEIQFMDKLNSKNSQIQQLNKKYRNLIDLNAYQMQQIEKITSKKNIHPQNDAPIALPSPSKQSQRKGGDKKFLKPGQIKNTESAASSRNEKVTQAMESDHRMPELLLQNDGTLPGFDKQPNLQSNQNTSLFQGPKIRVVEDKTQNREDIKKKIKSAYLYYIK